MGSRNSVTISSHFAILVRGLVSHSWLRHAASRVTMYTQAVTSAKRLAQSAVIYLFNKRSDALTPVTPEAPDSVSAFPPGAFLCLRKNGAESVSCWLESGVPDGI